MGKDKKRDKKSDSSDSDSDSDSRQHHHHRHHSHRSNRSQSRHSHHHRDHRHDREEKSHKRERSRSRSKIPEAAEADKKRVKTTTPQILPSQSPENREGLPSDRAPAVAAAAATAPQQQQQQPPSTQPVDSELQKRRERVEKWRKEQERRKKEAEEKAATEKAKKEKEIAAAAATDTGTLTMSLNAFSSTGTTTAPGWSSSSSILGADSDNEMNAVPSNSNLAAGNNGGESEVDELDEFMAGIEAEAQRDVKESSEKLKVLLNQKGGSSNHNKKEEVDGVDDKQRRKMSRTVFWTDEVAESLDGLYDVSDDDNDDVTGGGGESGNNAIDISDYFPENRTKEARRQKALAVLDVDHSSIDYPPFEKNLYVEVPEVAQMDVAEVARVRREELDGCMVHGRGCPRPIRTWGQCGLSARVLETLQLTLGFSAPTAIQRQAIPALMSGRDVLGCARTGSGKTLAYVLPMVRHVLAQPPIAPGNDGPIALVMAPTRELVQQITCEAARVAGRVGVRVVAVYGGADVAGQIGQLKRGAEVVVCTPGRMIDVLTANSGRVTNLRRVTFVVLDEADRMFDMGFEPQVSRIVGAVRPDRQLAMFSATFPYAIEQAARKMLHAPLEIICGGRGVACSDIVQSVEVLNTDDDRFARLLTLLTDFLAEQVGQALVFVNRQASADKLCQELLGAGLPVLVVHGGVDQLDRENAVNDFKRGERRILIATSVAARGLDVKGLDLVVNYEPPTHIEDYVHRIGRTGRAGRKGTAVTLLLDDENDERYAPDILKALRMSRQYVPAQLTALAERFAQHSEQAKLAGKSLAHGSGFGGKGFKFNEEERRAVEERRKLQRSMHMGEDEEYDDFNESDAEREENGEGGGSDNDNDSNSTVSKAAAIASAAATQVDAAISATMPNACSIIGGGNNDNGSGGSSNSGNGNGEQGTDISNNPSIMNVSAVNPPQMTQQQLAPNMPEDVQRAVSWAMRFNTAQRQLETMKRAAVQQTHFEEEVEINDLPQAVRFQLTQRDTINQIQDFTGAAVTARGRYIDPASKRIDEDDRKLYLLIEGTSREAVQLAKREIKKAIEEASYSGAAAAAAISFPAAGSGSGSSRYTVL